MPMLGGSSTTKTGHHDIAEISLKVALNTKNPNIGFSLLLKEEVMFYKKYY
jgi:hypothetical protein